MAETEGYILTPGSLLIFLDSSTKEVVKRSSLWFSHLNVKNPSCYLKFEMISQRLCDFSEESLYFPNFY